MPIPLPPGSPATQLCRPDECEGCHARLRDADARSAWMPLAPLLRDGAAMAALRRAWLPVSGDGALARQDDAALLDQIGAAIATGRLRLCRGDHKAAAEAQGVAAGQANEMPVAAPAPAAPPASKPPPAASAAAPQRAAAAPEPAPAPVDEPEIDAAAMAAVLRSAARDGTPFCEECEKARQQRSPAPA